MSLSTGTMQSRSVASTIIIVLAANTSGCTATWDLDPKVLPRLNGFEQGQTITLPTLNRDEQLDFHAGTQLQFRAQDDSEAHGKFRRIFVSPTAFTGIELKSGRVLKVDLTRIKSIKATRVSGGLTALVAVGGGLLAVGVLALLLGNRSF